MVLERVPDAKTIWLFQDTLTKSGIIEELFEAFNHVLETKGIITHKGTIVDFTFIDAPLHQAIKNSETLKEWLEASPEG